MPGSFSRKVGGGPVLTRCEEVVVAGLTALGGAR
jgi:hypothetical protein